MKKRLDFKNNGDMFATNVKVLQSHDTRDDLY